MNNIIHLLNTIDDPYDAIEVADQAIAELQAQISVLKSYKNVLARKTGGPNCFEVAGEILNSRVPPNFKAEDK